MVLFEKDKEVFKQTNRVTDITSEAGLFLQNASEFEKQAIEIETKLKVLQAMTDFVNKMSDADLEKTIRAKLESDDAVKQSNLSVSVDVADNKATLSGTVVSQDLRNKAIDLAKSAQPGLIVEDKIDVKPAA